MYFRHHKNKLAPYWGYIPSGEMVLYERGLKLLLIISSNSQDCWQKHEFDLTGNRRRRSTSTGWLVCVPQHHPTHWRSLCVLEVKSVLSGSPSLFLQTPPTVRETLSTGYHASPLPSAWPLPSKSSAHILGPGVRFQTFPSFGPGVETLSAVHTLPVRRFPVRY